MEITAYLKDLIAARRGAPQQDVISDLLAGEIDGQPIDDEAALDTAVLLFIAGLDTVTAALGWIFYHLARNPVDRRRIVDEPALIPQAVEELLRYHSFLDVARTAVVDTTVGECPIRKGDRILIDSRSAGRDEAEFDRAAIIDFDRPASANRHLAFGAGPHRCLGSHLARMELRVAVEEWHRLIPDYHLDPGAQIRFYGGGVAQLRELPLIVGGGPR
jgi:cytochrome P450